MKGGSIAVILPSPRRPTTRSARQSSIAASLPLSSNVPAGSYEITASVVRIVDSPTKTEPAGATDWIRDAVFTRSPATMPWSWAPSVTAASPVRTPARARRSGAPTSAPMSLTRAVSSRAARTARSASSSCATGEPQSAITASPMNFSITPP